MKALRILMDYLINQRVILAKLKQQQEQSGSFENYPTVADTLYLMEVVDTTLLKVYLRVNKSLVGPLVRVQNHCNLEESEKVLLDAQVFPGYHSQSLPHADVAHAEIPGTRGFVSWEGFAWKSVRVPARVGFSSVASGKYLLLNILTQSFCVLGRDIGVR